MKRKQELRKRREEKRQQKSLDLMTVKNENEDTKEILSQRESHESIEEEIKIEQKNIEQEEKKDQKHEKVESAQT